LLVLQKYIELHVYIVSSDIVHNGNDEKDDVVLRTTHDHESRQIKTMGPRCVSTDIAWVVDHIHSLMACEGKPPPTGGTYTIMYVNQCLKTTQLSQLDLTYSV